MSDEHFEGQIIIRKRRNDEDDEFHGGVWKLAFADFMTAMMAFFLVMWLVNSTTKENRAAIVQYFNPVHLVDSNPGRKGLRDPGDVTLGNGLHRANSSNVAPSRRLDGSELNLEGIERGLYESPLETLDKIANADQQEHSLKHKNIERLVSERRLADPFDRSDAFSKTSAGRKEITLPAETPMVRQGEGVASRSLDDTPLKEIEPKARPSDNSNLASVRAIKAALVEIVRKEAGPRREAPHIEAAQTDDGLLISLTDEANFSMFAIGSIAPKPQLVRILKRIGRLLAGQKGEIELHGHTDGRSYKSLAYDNWRLSADRANVAQYMLLRGGLARERIARISGFADRRLKEPEDPFAASNRRIEILIRRTRD
jgi:chemotaxis protein MotB